MKDSILYIVATPIGNLEDITLRALRVLGEVDVILAEDTRVTKKLLQHYDIKKQLLRYDEHTAAHMHPRVAQLLSEGAHIAVVSDAGTPGVSDPGSRLVRYVREQAPDTRIVPIPGPSALITALSASGLSADAFTFMGYPPHKKGRKTFFEEMRGVAVRPVVMYESPHRLQKTLKEISEIMEGVSIVVGKELTKIYEELWRGTCAEALLYFEGKKAKGEFVVIIL